VVKHLGGASIRGTKQPLSALVHLSKHLGNLPRIREFRAPLGK
jgi:hypothetical protein